MLKKILNRTIDLLIPRSCINCGLYVNKELCDHCFNLPYQYCPESFFTRKKSSDWEMSPKDKMLTNLEKVFYFYKYDDIIHSIIDSIKYDFKKENIKIVIKWFNKSTEFNQIDFKQFDYLTFVPLSDKRERWRGFNHTKFITHQLSIEFGIPYFQILKKHINTKAQIDLSREERLINLRHSFKVRSDLPVNLRDEKILLIDDICTTGSTLIECASTIKGTYPNLKIYAMCLARGT